MENSIPEKMHMLIKLRHFNTSCVTQNGLACKYNPPKFDFAYGHFSLLKNWNWYVVQVGLWFFLSKCFFLKGYSFKLMLDTGIIKK